MLAPHMMGTSREAAWMAAVCAASRPVVPITMATPLSAAMAACATVAAGTVKSISTRGAEVRGELCPGRSRPLLPAHGDRRHHDLPALDRRLVRGRRVRGRAGGRRQGHARGAGAVALGRRAILRKSRIATPATSRYHAGAWWKEPA